MVGKSVLPAFTREFNQSRRGEEREEILFELAGDENRWREREWKKRNIQRERGWGGGRGWLNILDGVYDVVVVLYSSRGEVAIPCAFKHTLIRLIIF